MKKELNKWQYGISMGKCPLWEKGFHPFIRIWVLKLIRFPLEGDILKKCHYKGFLFNKKWSPLVTMCCKSFKIFGKHYSIDYPIKIKLEPLK